MTILQLPYPPTANHLFANAGKKRVKTDHYKAWIKEAGWAVVQQRPAKVLGAYRLQLIAQRPDKRARDIDNLLKCVSDLLKTHGVIEEDSKAQSVFAGWSLEGSVPGGGVIVSVEPADAPIFVMGRAA